MNMRVPLAHLRLFDQQLLAGELAQSIQGEAGVLE
jgi:hypothetical protein